MKGRPRQITDKKIKDICRLGKSYTVAEISEMVQLIPKHVLYYLKKYGITPIRTYKKRDIEKEKIGFKITELISILEDHFGRKLRLDSKSLFSKTRIEKGICLHIIHKYFNDPINHIKPWEYLMEELNLGYKEYKEDIKYAISKNVDHIVSEIETKIKNKWIDR